MNGRAGLGESNRQIISDARLASAVSGVSMGFLVKQAHPKGVLWCQSEISAPAPGLLSFAEFVRSPERTQIGLIAAESHYGHRLTHRTVVSLLLARAYGQRGQYVNSGGPYSGVFLSHNLSQSE